MSGMSDYRAAMRHFTHANRKIANAEFVLDLLEDEPENIDATTVDTDAPAQIEEAIYHLQVANEILEGDHEEGSNGFPDKYRSDPLL